jgi:hypothetical protein
MRPFSLIKVLESSPQQIVTLKQVKDYMNRNDSVHDELLNQIIKSATLWIENRTRRAITIKRIQCLSIPHPSLLWPFQPYIATESVIGFLDYERKKGIRIKKYIETDECLSLDFQGPWLEVIYKAGYETPPEDLIHAVLMMVNYLYDIRFETVDRTPIDQLIAPYCVRRL